MDCWRHGIRKAWYTDGNSGYIGFGHKDGVLGIC
jgi:hypothetical protein